MIPLSLVAAAGAAAAIVARPPDGRSGGAATFVAPPPRPPGAVRDGETARTVWPAGLDGWTVVLQSTPLPLGPKEPAAVATAAVHDGLAQVGVLDSSSLASLHPGYFVVFSGVYGAADGRADTRSPPFVHAVSGAPRVSRRALKRQVTQSTLRMRFVFEKENICNIMENRVQSLGERASGGRFVAYPLYFQAVEQET